MTSIHRPSGIRMFASALVAALLAVAGVAIAVPPAHADVENVKTTLSVTADPATPGSAVLHAEMIGPYVDGGGVIPAGTWSFLVADGAGATLFAQDVVQPAGGPTSAEVVWSDIPAGVSVSGIVMYVPSEPSEQFVFAGATTAFASEGTPEDSTEVGPSEATPTATGDASDSLPLWLGILIGAASVLVAALGAVLLVRRVRRSGSART